VNAFYESPAGQRMLSTLPQLMQESMEIGQEWGEKVGRQAAQEAEQDPQTSVKARSRTRACINNLRIMDAAKEQAAMEQKWSGGRQIEPGSAAEKSVLAYIKGNKMPVCPAGGDYELRPIGQLPTCSVEGHELPQ